MNKQVAIFPVNRLSLKILETIFSERKQAASRKGGGSPGLVE